MNKTRSSLLPAGRLVWLLVAALSTHEVKAASHEDHLPVLKTKTGWYTNVTVTTKADSYVFILHSRGMESVPVSDLSPEVLRQLGYQVESRSPSSAATAASTRNSTSVHSPEVKSSGRTARSSAHFSLSPLLVCLVVVGGIYLFICHCLALICRKAGSEPGFLIWLPIFQMLPLIKAAGMPTIWFLAFLVPVVNFFAHIVWSINIVSAREKSPIVAVLLILPVTSLFALLYLAFSSAPSRDEPHRYKSMALETA